MSHLNLYSAISIPLAPAWFRAYPLCVLCCFFVCLPAYPQDDRELNVLDEAARISAVEQSAFVLYEAGKYLEALAQYRQLSELAPEDLLGPLGEARSDLSLGRKAEGLAAYARLLEVARKQGTRKALLTKKEMSRLKSKLDELPDASVPPGDDAQQSQEQPQDPAVGDGALGWPWVPGGSGGLAFGEIDAVGETYTLDLGKGQKLTLTYIPAGKFSMGSPRNEEGRMDNETQHEVELTRPYLMGITEVTQGQWAAVMGTTIRQQRDKANPGWTLHGEGADYPMYYVNWEEASEFCAKLTELAQKQDDFPEGAELALPTEAQWEYACRAGTRTAYHTGDGLAALKRAGWASYDGKWGSAGGTKPVKRFEKNKWGLYDMHGNVWEWCADWYGDYPHGQVKDPNGPRTGRFRVLRGGSWLNPPANCRAAYRRRIAPDYRRNNLGFRVVLLSPQDP